jgi:hypothetical protein
MYEIQNTGLGKWQIYDTYNQRCVAYSKSHRKISDMILTLQKKGFEGEIPAFFLVNDGESGINLDN